MGLNYTYISPFPEAISEYDEVLGEYVPTDRVRSRDQRDLQLFWEIVCQSNRSTNFIF